MSTESIESLAGPASSGGASTACTACGAPLAEDQRYCLQCGERATPMSSVLLGGAPAPAVAAGSAVGAQPPAGPGMAPLVPDGPPGTTPPSVAGSDSGANRGNAVTVIAGVGVLLLAMGIGVLIGRSSSSKPSAAAPQVISVASAGGAAGTAPSAPESESFTDDWPAGTTGYTVQLQTLSSAGTQVSAVQAAKSAAEGKGAKSVGALKSDDFVGMTAGNYVIYAGKYTKKAEAEKALPGLRKSFPGASVLQVGAGTGKSSGKGSSAPAAGAGSGAGANESHPAPPSVVEDLHKSKGKSYEEKSKNLPDVISTG
ncbi:MAG TPA: zinc ribbon domain-containing protein [Solirubrobacteraceae bacterium]